MQNEHEALARSSIFFFNDTATTEIYTLSLHDALPIFENVTGSMGDDTITGNAEGNVLDGSQGKDDLRGGDGADLLIPDAEDRKSTRLNSSHANISYAVFCLKKKTLASRPGTSSSAFCS